MDLPAPEGPQIIVWPRSPTCKLNRNGVEPLVAAYNRGGLLRGIMAEGFSRCPAQTAVIGRRSATFSVCRRFRRTFL